MHIGEELWGNGVADKFVSMQVSDGIAIRTYPGLPRSIYRSFEHSAERVPQKTAVVDDSGEAYTYAELYGRVTAAAMWLCSEKKVKRGEHVALMLYNSIEFCIAYLALNKIGCVVIPLPTKYKQEEILSLLDKSEASLVISEADFLDFFSNCSKKSIDVCTFPELGGHIAQRKDSTDVCDVPDHIALLMFTSGTTSQSKVVTIRNYNVMHAVVTYEKTLGITQNDSALIPVPIYLITGLVAVFSLMMHVGGTVYLNKFFDAKRALCDIAKYNITFFHASPTVFTLLLHCKNEYPALPALRMFACGSSNMPPEKIKRLHEWLPNCAFRTVYGLTETTSPATIFPSDAAVSDYIGSSGLPVPGLSFKITDDDGVEVTDGKEGRVLVRGSNITRGYYKTDTPALQDGWLDTGDIGYFNSAGYLYIVDRRKDMINRGGEKICSFDVENELSVIDGIEDAAVVGISDELYGEVPAAVVTLRNGYIFDEEEIRKYLKTKMAGYKVPVKIQAVDKIPVTENLKADKKKIRQLLAD